MTQNAEKYQRGTQASGGQEQHQDSVAEEEVAPELPGRVVQASIRAPLFLPSSCLGCWQEVSHMDSMAFCSDDAGITAAHMEVSFGRMACFKTAAE